MELLTGGAVPNDGTDKPARNQRHTRPERKESQDAKADRIRVRISSQSQRGEHQCNEQRATPHGEDEDAKPGEPGESKSWRLFLIGCSHGSWFGHS